jgi:hypothetical protein
MDLKETEARYDCAGKDQQELNRPTDAVSERTAGVQAL